jgi:hypothetical protein
MRVPKASYSSRAKWLYCKIISEPTDLGEFYAVISFGFLRTVQADVIQNMRLTVVLFVDESNCNRLID